MATRVYVVARVPAAARDACEGLVAPYLVSPNDPGVYTFSVPLVPLAGPTNATPTHYGVCSATLDDSGLYQALPALSAAVPGTAYKVVSPFRDFSNAADWVGWLATAGLQPRIEPIA